MSVGVLIKVWVILSHHRIRKFRINTPFVFSWTLKNTICVILIFLTNFRDFAIKIVIHWLKWSAATIAGDCWISIKKEVFGRVSNTLLIIVITKGSSSTNLIERLFPFLYFLINFIHILSFHRWPVIPLSFHTLSAKRSALWKLLVVVEASFSRWVSLMCIRSMLIIPACHWLAEIWTALRW